MVIVEQGAGATTLLDGGLRADKNGFGLSRVRFDVTSRDSVEIPYRLSLTINVVCVDVTCFTRDLAIKKFPFTFSKSI